MARPLLSTPTFARFCQENAELFYDCHADPNIRDSALNDFPSATAENARSDRPWHRVRLGVNGSNRDAGWTWPYDNTTVAPHKWDYWDDWKFWQAGSRIPPAHPHYSLTCTNTALVGNGTCLDGTRWYHASTDVGNTNPYANGQLVGVHGPDLANHYFDIKPDSAYAKTYAGTGLMRKLVFLIYTLPDPAPYERVLRSRVRPLVAEADLGIPHVVEDHGGSYDAAPMISYVTARTLAHPGVVWAGSIEHPRLAANLDDRVQAMALSQDGTTVLDTTLLDHGALTSAFELGYPYSSEGARGGPGPRSGFWLCSRARLAASS